MKNNAIEPAFVSFFVHVDANMPTYQIAAFAGRLVSWAKDAGHVHAAAWVVQDVHNNRQWIELDGLYLADGYTAAKTAVTRAAKQLSVVGFRPATTAPTKEPLA